MGAIDKLLTRAFEPPDDDPNPNSLPMFLETSGDDFVQTRTASRAQVRLAAKLHREIARRHSLLADKLAAFAEREERS